LRGVALQAIEKDIQIADVDARIVVAITIKKFGDDIIWRLFFNSLMAFLIEVSLTS